MTKLPLNLLLLGDAADGDFKAIVEDVRAAVDSDALRMAVDLPALQRLIAIERWFPDLIVVLLAWPDEFSEAEVYELLALCPLARVVCCFGPWCDSDGRTRTIWPLAVRIPLADSPARLARELALFEDQESPDRPLPMTASRAEIFASDFQPLQRQQQSLAVAAVVSPDRHFCQMLESTLTTAGVQICKVSESDRAACIIFDADLWNAERQSALETICRARSTAKFVAATGFLRPDLDAALRRAGADEVWSKVSPLQQLASHLRR